jgi:nucleoside-diphosphate-sugar epimerase
MKKVLLTGATGYIGKFTIKHLLERGYEVHAVSSKTPDGNYPEKSENLIWHKANLLSIDETEKLVKSVSPTHLLHFAWFVEHGKFWNAPENLRWLSASLHLAECFAAGGGRRIVCAGTCAEYDWARQGIFSEKDLPERPQTLYGTAKTALSLTLEKFAAVSGLDFASGKIFFPFGADELPNRLIPSVIISLLENKPAATSHGRQIRDYMFVEDVAEAFVALLDGDVRGAVNIASGRRTELKEIIEIIAEIIGKPELLQIGAMAVGKDEPPEIVAAVERLGAEVNYNKDFDLRERLKETVDYWKRVYEIND